MTLNFAPPGPDPELKPRIVVVGVGGAGGNAVNNMIASNLEGVEFVVANTDAQALSQSNAERTIQLGTNITQGLGAGARPEVGREAAKEALDPLMEHLQGAHMLFITAGMGGGTGTGAAPVIAEAARERGMLTVGVVTKPFHFEGRHRMRLAEEGIEELQDFVDTLIIIPNQNLFRVANEKTTFADAFKMADDVLNSGVRGVTDLMVMPGLINLDFADIRTVMSEMGKAMMGTGEGEGDNRACAASEAAISNPLLEDVTMKGAHGVLINITGGPDMTLFEVDEAANRIREEVDEDANIIFGSTFDEALEGKIRVSVVATGIEADANAQPRPMPMRRTTAISRPAPAPTAEPAADIPAAVETAPAEAAEIAPEPQAELITDEPALIPEAVPTQPHEEQAATPEATQDVAAQAVPQQPELTATPIEEEAAPAAAAVETPAEPRAAKLPEVPNPRDAFIPPPPVNTGPRDTSNLIAPDPFAAADMANGRSESPKKGRTTLFRRVTSALTKTEEEAAPKEQNTPAPAATAAPRAQVAEPAQRAAAPVQQDLGGLNPEERLEPSRAEQEMLEIPAFLRRQAN